MDDINLHLFVFVVCGERLHTDTLNVSLPFLKKRTKHRIVVLTDLSRNEGEINHTDVIDVKTPSEYTHHQACIYLKTGLHQFLPKGNVYCYLDSDVLAIGGNVDSIFDEYVSPITFAQDRAPLNYFSPYALHCGCMEKFAARKQARVDRINWYHETIAEIEATVQASQRKWYYFFKRWQYNLSGAYYRLNSKYRMHKQTGTWYLNDGTKMVLEEFDEVYEYACDHLHKKLVSTFHVHMLPKDWKHWNGGVFLFSDASYAFMQEWHKWSISFFDDKEWCTRDQASLVLAVWNQGLQNQPTLDPKWNFLLDYDKAEISNQGNEYKLLYDGETIEFPEFVHIYRHFGDTTWSVWNYIMQNG